ncbi:MAG: hypothetical protein WC476_06255 [Phycisphaerae bacterium]|jgi:hypothetical protein
MKLAKICLLAAFLMVPVQLTYALNDFSSWDNPRQCHGDADGLQSLGRWVTANDLYILQAVYAGGDPVFWTDPTYDSRADFDRNFVINSLDEAIIMEWGSQPTVPADCPKKLELETMTGDCLVPDSNYTINWDWRIFTDYVPLPGSEDFSPGTCTLYYSVDYGENWVEIDTVPGGTSYEWLVPEAISDQCWLRIDDIEHYGLTDTKTWVRPCTAALGGDLNSDCYVDFFDFGILASAWLDMDGTDIDDLSDMVFTWLECNNPCDPWCGE